MRNRIFGAIGALWGGSIVFNHFGGHPPGVHNAAYAAGHTAALVMGILLFAVGLYYLMWQNP